MSHLSQIVKIFLVAIIFFLPSLPGAEAESQISRQEITDSPENQGSEGNSDRCRDGEPGTSYWHNLPNYLTPNLNQGEVNWHYVDGLYPQTVIIHVLATSVHVEAHNGVCANYFSGIFDGRANLIPVVVPCPLTCSIKVSDIWVHSGGYSIIVV